MYDIVVCPFPAV